MSKRNDKLKAEIIRRRVREMYPKGFSMQKIIDLTGSSAVHVRKLIAQEFPNGREKGRSHE